MLINAKLVRKFRSTRRPVNGSRAIAALPRSSWCKPLLHPFARRPFAGGVGSRVLDNPSSQRTRGPSLEPRH